MIEDRVKDLNNATNPSGECVVYVMSRDQRVHDNHALLYSQNIATENGLPLVVVFNLLPSLGYRSYEHFNFMLQGLEQLAEELKKYYINFILTIGEPEQELEALFKTLNPMQVVFDFNPLRYSVNLSKQIANSSNFLVSEVDTHNIIPIWKASDKKEFAAYTFRPKVHRLLEKYLIEPDKLVRHAYDFTKKVNSHSFLEARKAISNISKCNIKISFQSGEKSALRHLQEFIENKLENYAVSRNDITADGQSELSPYLHFGQISSLRVALEVMHKSNKPPFLFEQPFMPKPTSDSIYDGMNSLLEEMIVRKELSDNFCYYNPNYDSLDGAEDWAKKTIKEHAHDKREFLYNLSELEHAKTHDKSWNAAQLQLTKTGKMHGYMRMYWAKKILEWSIDAEVALKNAIYLNDKYSIDGGDPNGYVGIMWSIAGVHDRAWNERSIFGKIRYMNEAGLKRKFDLDKYIRAIDLI